MTVTSYSGWVADGRPFKDAACIDSFATTLRGFGYTVYTIGDSVHLHANPPEDHTPFSHTPWPGAQPYPYVMACDIMPGGKWSLADLGARIVADKQAGVPGTEWIKYINWTDHNGHCWHDSWEPAHSRRPSTDRGHIHISARTDYVHKTTAFVPFQEDDMPSAQEIAQAILDAPIGSKNYPNRTVRQVLNDLSNERDALVDPNITLAKAGIPADSPLAEVMEAAASYLGKPVKK